ncbi:hypothetical protein EDC04DRAFT_2685321 [Pisolithus marmoratus]|nr:hypothetical protein EDC04DRAFT_2724533 [Pisolithus marmoratus]KAI6039457.1 hypothetical protein EDC04DRAFT_2685321 [Pisolithus marmoratus]
MDQLPAYQSLLRRTPRQLEYSYGYLYNPFLYTVLSNAWFVGRFGCRSTRRRSASALAVCPRFSSLSNTRSICHPFSSTWGAPAVTQNGSNKESGESGGVYALNARTGFWRSRDPGCGYGHKSKLRARAVTLVQNKYVVLKVAVEAFSQVSIPGTSSTPSPTATARSQYPPKLLALGLNDAWPPLLMCYDRYLSEIGVIWVDDDCPCDYTFWWD